MGAPSDEEDAVLPKLRAARSNLTSLLRAAADVEQSLAGVDERLSRGMEAGSAAAEKVAPLQSQAIATKALHARINRAVSPALTVLQSFSLVESLQSRLLRLSSARGAATPGARLARLLKYVDTVDRLHLAIASVTDGCEPAVQRLQEAVEFVSRTKATDHLRIHRLRETLAALKALYEAEVDAMRYDGLLDEALLRLQDEFESLLQQLRHRGIGEDTDDRLPDDSDGSDHRQLGSDFEIEVLGRIAKTLATNDCLDICIDIFVKVRYRRAAKALMRLNPDYLKTYAPEEIDGMEWESLETAITLWIEHFELAVRAVFVAEKRLCVGLLAGVMDGAICSECFAKIADKIMAVFFRFGEGVARSSKDPHKLFKLLDMFDAMDRMRGEFVEIFAGDPGQDICARFRELQKLLVHAASKVFWGFGVQIEGLQDGAPPPADGSVPNVVRYAVNYLKCLAAGGYAAAMGRVLRTEQVWKAGFLSRPDPDESLLRDAVLSLLDALQRNVEAKRCRYLDKAAAHVFAMNAYWYMYMRARESELAALVGEETMRRRYKTAAEEAAYAYQLQAWGPFVELLEREGGSTPASWEQGSQAAGAVARGKMEAFMKGFDENLRRHRAGYCIPDVDLREQIGEAVAKLVVPAYEEFLRLYSPVMQGRSFLPPDSIRGRLAQLFDGGGGGGGGGRGMRTVEVGRRAVEGGGEVGKRSMEGGGEGGKRSMEGGRRSVDGGRTESKPKVRFVRTGNLVPGLNSK